MIEMVIGWALEINEKSQRLNIHIPPRLKEAVKRLCMQEQQHASQYIIKLIEDDLKQRGLI